MTDESNKIWIVIPAYNEEAVIADVIGEVKAAGYANILVVDDGSRDRTAGKASTADVVVVRHLINRGKGAAAKTGIEAAKVLGADIIVTLDGDGQHDPQDILPMLAAIRGGSDVVLGTRLLKSDGMPWYKVLHNRIGNVLVWLIYGLYVTDSQSGFRAYTRRAADLINTRSDRYEYDSEVIYEIKRHRLSFVEMPIRVRYTEYSTGKAQKMNLRTGIKALIKMMLYS